MPTALALSPHLDDAAFSCGGTLATLAASGWRVVMATVFTQSVPGPTGFALACQLDKGLDASVDYMRLRRAEDEAAARCLGVEVRHMPFREAPHRGYNSAPALFAGLREEDGVVDELAPAVAALLAEHRPEVVLLPQCVGSHADHVQAVRAFDRAGWNGSTLWWRDFPYVVRDASPREPLRERMVALPERDVALTPAEAEAKRRSCLAYASQLGFQFGGAEGLDRRLAASGETESFRLTGSVLPF